MIKLFSKRPIVSVILASFNHEQFVQKAINSVLNQTFKDFELILIDDGSTDKTYEKACEIKDERFKCFKINENRQVNPRNFALKLCKGKYIAFQNSDDEWKKNKLELQVKALEENQKLIACFTGVNVIDKNGEVTHDTYNEYLTYVTNKGRFEWLRHFFDNGNLLTISSSLIRAKDLKKIGGLAENLCHAADLDLWIQLAARGDIFVIEKKLTSLRVVGDSNYSAPKPQAYNRVNLEYIELFRRYIEKPLFSHLKYIFPEIFPKEFKGEIYTKILLVKYLWSKNSPKETLFANMILNDLLKKSENRKVICKEFGVSIVREYIERKGLLRFELEKF